MAVAVVIYRSDGGGKHRESVAAKGTGIPAAASGRRHAGLLGTHQKLPLTG